MMFRGVKTSYSAYIQSHMSTLLANKSYWCSYLEGIQTQGRLTWLSTSYMIAIYICWRYKYHIVILTRSYCDHLSSGLSPNPSNSICITFLFSLLSRDWWVGHLTAILFLLFRLIHPWLNLRVLHIHQHNESLWLIYIPYDSITFHSMTQPLWYMYIRTPVVQ